MYQPIWQEEFKEVFNLENGKFEISHDNATRRFLMSHINDNVFQNINSKISLRSYDADHKFHKNALDLTRKQEIIDEIIQESSEKASVEAI